MISGNLRKGLREVFISKKRWREMEEQIASLGSRICYLELQADTMSFYHGKVDFPKFVRITESDINKLNAKIDQHCGATQNRSGD